MGYILLDSQSKAWEMIPSIDGYYCTYKISTLFEPTPFYPKMYFTMPLPVELIHQILIYHIEWLLKHCKFDDAERLMYNNPYLLRKYYNRYVGEEIVPDGFNNEHNTMRNGIHWVFQYAKCIFNDTFMARNVAKHETFFFEIASNWGLDDATFSPRRIYNQFNVSVNDLGEFVRPEIQLGLLAILQGERYGDVIWYSGSNEIQDSIFEYETKEYPVIVLAIEDCHQNLLTLESARQIQGWKQFVDLLHYVGGPETSVYICDSLQDREYSILRFTV